MNSTSATPYTRRPANSLFAAESRTWLIVAVGAALTLHVIAVARSPLIAPDGIGYIQFARELAAAPWTAIREHAQHPGYPLLIRATHAVTGHLISGDAGWELAARLACGISGVACVVMVWLLVRETLNRSAANVAAVVFAVLPTVRQNAADALSDSSHLMLYLLAAWMVCRAATCRSQWRLFLAGIASGLAFWVRPEGLSVSLIGAGCVLVVPGWRIALGGTRRALIGSSAILAGAALVAAPLAWTSAKLTGKLAGKPGWQQLQTPDSPTAGPLADAPAPPLPQPVAGNVTWNLALETPTPWNDPVTTTAVSAVSRLGACLAEVLHGILLAPLLLGIPIVWRRMAWPPFSVCLMLALAHIGMLLLLYALGGYINRRHLLPLIAMLMPSISLGALAIGRWLSALAERRRGARRLTPAAAMLLLTILIPRAIRPLHESHQHKLQAAEWLRAHCEPSDVVGSNAVEVVYHASIDGGVIPGSLLRPGLPINADGPLLANTHLVVALNAENRLPSWTSGIPQQFLPVERIRGNPDLRQRDLVIYRRREIVQSAAESTSLNLKR